MSPGAHLDTSAPADKGVRTLHMEHIEQLSHVFGVLWHGQSSLPQRHVTEEQPSVVPRDDDPSFTDEVPHDRLPEEQGAAQTVGNHHNRLARWCRRWLATRSHNLPPPP